MWLQCSLLGRPAPLGHLLPAVTCQALPPPVPLLSGGQHPTSRLWGQGCQADGLITLEVKTHFKTGIRYVILKSKEGQCVGWGRVWPAGRAISTTLSGPLGGTTSPPLECGPRRPQVQSRGLQSVAGPGVPPKGAFRLKSRVVCLIRMDRDQKIVGFLSDKVTLNLIS